MLKCTCKLQKEGTDLIFTAPCVVLTMAEELKNEFEEIEEETYFLIDEDGVETPFEVIGRIEIEGVEYLAFMPLDSDECEYVILRKGIDEEGNIIYDTIDDDEEFETVAEIFEDELFSDFDLDEIEGDDEE